MPNSALHLRALEVGDQAGIDQVASRMRATLIEVLGETRGSALYSMEWLRGRVREHLDLGKDYARVWLAENASGQAVGQLIVRREQDAAEKAVPPIEQDAFGLVSTIYVGPEHRRNGVAQQLVQQAEQWMIDQGLQWAATHTGQRNDKLIRLFESRGYVITLRTPEMVRLTREIAANESESAFFEKSGNR